MQYPGGGYGAYFGLTIRATGSGARYGEHWRADAADMANVAGNCYNIGSRVHHSFLTDARLVSIAPVCAINKPGTDDAYAWNALHTMHGVVESCRFNFGLLWRIQGTIRERFIGSIWVAMVDTRYSVGREVLV